MGKAMKAMKVMKKKAVSTMTAGAVTTAVAEKAGLKNGEVKGVISAISALGVAELKKSGKFTIPGLAMIKLKHKPPTPAGKREIFGKVVHVKAMKASKRVKLFAVKAFKDAVA